VIALPLLAFVLLTAANAFFVLAEFSLVTVDRAAIDQEVQAGDWRAKAVRSALRQLSFQLSGTQLGITLAALLTGYLAEPALSRLLAPVTGHHDWLTHLAAIGVATLFSMLFGELAPKNAALARPMPIVRATMPVQLVFVKVFGWLIRALNASANAVVRQLGVRPQQALASARSPEELGLLAAISARAGALPEETAMLLQRTIRFGDKRAAEAMTPRVDMVAIAASSTVSALLAAARGSGHSRFPVYESSVDFITGVAIVTDALGVPPLSRTGTRVSTIAREPVYVPESLDLDGVYAALQASGAEMAVVVDEYGGTDGLVSLEDLAEELVGEISDEHDQEPAAYELITPGPPSGEPEPAGVLVDGVVREDELAELTGFRLPDGPYETLAGFLLSRLGHIPQPGEAVDEHAWRFIVEGVDRRRIEQVRVIAPTDHDV
jgi:CBS domain containing-hemolysin-like protein